MSGLVRRNLGYWLAGGAFSVFDAVVIESWFACLLARRDSRLDGSRVGLWLVRFDLNVAVW